MPDSVDHPFTDEDAAPGDAPAGAPPGPDGAGDLTASASPAGGVIFAFTPPTVIAESTATTVAFVPQAPPAPRPVDGVDPPPVAARPVIPKPRPPVIPERTERGFRASSVEVERADNRACYITIRPRERPGQRVYVAAHAFDALIQLATTPGVESGLLWQRFSQIPLDRPLPSRALEEELKVLLVALASDVRR